MRGAGLSRGGRRRAEGGFPPRGHPGAQAGRGGRGRRRLAAAPRPVGHGRGLRHSRPRPAHPDPEPRSPEARRAHAGGDPRADPWDVYPDSEDSELGRLYRRALAERVPVSMEHRYEWPDGSASWLKMRACPVPEGLAVFWHDITERKEAELSLRESEARYRGLFDAMDEGFLLARVLRDGEGRAVDAVLLEGNPLASRMTRLSPIDGQRLSEVLPVPDPVWIETCDRVSRTGVTERREHRAAGWGTGTTSPPRR
ncbi:PAS domain-containing protein [Cereibacter sphaeroides]|uniref:PAS domain-containing protein n=1 Tax=Cereibacter sphaeroides TaxID=1063 RepID=UPI001F3901A0|nr:PAS domain S-box protein [Cereibacter sphaeroides]